VNSSLWISKDGETVAKAPNVSVAVNVTGVVERFERGTPERAPVVVLNVNP
jgi:hypothetical protein